MGCLKLEHSVFSNSLRVVHNDLKISVKSHVGAYRYGVNSQEKEDEIAKGVYTAEYWKYDSRIARRCNLDPKGVKGLSQYACFTNNPIKLVDLKGDTSTFFTGDGSYFCSVK